MAKRRVGRWSAGAVFGVWLVSSCGVTRGYERLPSDEAAAGEDAVDDPAAAAAGGAGDAPRRAQGGSPSNEVAAAGEATGGAGPSDDAAGGTAAVEVGGGGAGQAGADSGEDPECTQDDDCDDHLFCSGVEACDAHGRCTTGSSVCAANLVCNEQQRRCQCANAGVRVAGYCGAGDEATDRAAVARADQECAGCGASPAYERVSSNNCMDFYCKQ